MGVIVRYFESDLTAHASGMSGDIGIQAHYTEAYRPFTLSLVGQTSGGGRSSRRSATPSRSGCAWARPSIGRRT